MADSLDDLKAELEALRDLRDAASDAHDTDGVANYNRAIRDTTKEYQRGKSAIDQQRASAARLQGTLVSVSNAGRAVAIGLSGAAAASVRLANPAAFERFTLATRDLGGTIGQILLPVLQRMTEFVRGLADRIINLDDGTKGLIANLATAGIVLGAAAAILPRLFLGFQALSSVILATRAALVALGVGTGGVLLVLGALIGGLALAGEGGGAFAGVFEQAGKVLASLGQIVGAVFKVIEPFAKFLAGTLVKALEGVLFVVNTLIDALTSLVKILTFGLVDLKGKLKVEGPKKSSIGAAVRPAEITSGEELARKFAIAGLQSGQSEAQKQTGLLRGILEVLNADADRRGDPEARRRINRMMTGQG